MEVAPVSSSSTQVQANISVKANKQQEAVINTIMQGVEASAPRAPGQTGQRLNTAA